MAHSLNLCHTHTMVGEQMLRSPGGGVMSRECAGRAEEITTSLLFSTLPMLPLSGMLPSSVLVLFTLDVSIRNLAVKPGLMPACSKNFVIRVDDFPLSATICFLVDYAKDSNPFPHA